MSRILWGGTLYGQPMPEPEPEKPRQIEAPTYSYRCDLCPFECHSHDEEALWRIVARHLAERHRVKAEPIPQFPAPPSILDQVKKIVGQAAAAIERNKEEHDAKNAPPAPKPKQLVKGSDGVYKPKDD